MRTSLGPLQTCKMFFMNLAAQHSQQMFNLWKTVNFVIVDLFVKLFILIKRLLCHVVRHWNTKEGLNDVIHGPTHLSSCLFWTKKGFLYFFFSETNISFLSQRKNVGGRGGGDFGSDVASKLAGAFEANFLDVKRSRSRMIKNDKGWVFFSHDKRLIFWWTQL